MLLQNAVTQHPANSTWDAIQRLPVDGLDDPVRDEELYRLYAYTKFLAIAKFGDSDQLPSHGGCADGAAPGQFPGHGGCAVGADQSSQKQQGGSSSSTSGGGPSPANHQ